MIAQITVTDEEDVPGRPGAPSAMQRHFDEMEPGQTLLVIRSGCMYRRPDSRPYAQGGRIEALTVGMKAHKALEARVEALEKAFAAKAPPTEKKPEPALVPAPIKPVIRETATVAKKMKFNDVVEAFEKALGAPTDSNNGGYAWKVGKKTVTVVYPMTPSPDDPHFEIAEVAFVDRTGTSGLVKSSSHVVAETTVRPEYVVCHNVEQALAESGACSFKVLLAAAKRMLGK